MSFANKAAGFMEGFLRALVNPIGTLSDVASGKYDGPPCAICGEESEQETLCCRTPLCPRHIRAWKEMPGPCPCHNCR